MRLQLKQKKIFKKSELLKIKGPYVTYEVKLHIMKKCVYYIIIQCSNKKD